MRATSAGTSKTAAHPSSHTAGCTADGRIELCGPASTTMTRKTIGDSTATAALHTMKAIRTRANGRMRVQKKNWRESQVLH